MKILGATTLLFFTWLASISLFLNISWLKVIDEIGRYALFIWSIVQSKIDDIKDKIEVRRKKAERKVVFDAEKKRIADKAPPKIEPIVLQLEKSTRAEKERQVPMFEPPLTCSAEALYKRLKIIALIATDFPEPVVPAISKCGIFDRSATTELPPISFPRAKVRGDAISSYTFDLSISPNVTNSLFSFGISRPM